MATKAPGRIASIESYGASKARSPRKPTISARVASKTPEERHDILLCQALGPAAPCDICGVDCSECNCRRLGGWEAARAIAWQAYAQGEYVGHARLAHVPEYRLRVDDQLDMTYRLTRDEILSEMRLAGIGRLADVEWAILEPQGKMSFVRKGDDGSPQQDRDDPAA